jgi:hypothetical protein
MKPMTLLQLLMTLLPLLVPMMLLALRLKLQLQTACHHSRRYGQNSEQPCNCWQMQHLAILQHGVMRQRTSDAVLLYHCTHY